MSPRALPTPKPVRWKKDELLARLAPIDADRLRQLVCELYRAGPDKVRDRVEGAMEPTRKPAKPTEDVVGALDDVEEFVKLADAQEFLHGRAVSPKRKSLWRHEFRSAFETTIRLLASPQGERAAEILESLVDLARYASGHYVFRSEDALEAAKVVLSDQVAALWRALATREGVEGLAKIALPQFLRWEEPYGWTRGGGSVSEKERSLAEVLAELVPSRPAWERIVGAWVSQLDAILAEDTKPPEPPPGRKKVRREQDWQLKSRLEKLESRQPSRVAVSRLAPANRRRARRRRRAR